MLLSAKEVISKLNSAPMSHNLILIPQGLQVDPKTLDPLNSKKDIDYWTTKKDRQSIFNFVLELEGYLISRCDSPVWLNHDIYLIPSQDGLLLVDITVGDLMVGPVLLVRESNIHHSGQKSTQFSDSAKIADLVIRPLLRGNKLDLERKNVAVCFWQSLGADRKNKVMLGFGATISPKLALLIAGYLEYRINEKTLHRQLQFLSIKKTITSRSRLRIARQKFIFNLLSKITRRNKPFGRYTKGLLISISGTDGTGKTTTISTLKGALNNQEIRNCSYYMGRGRGNLPGTELLRRLVSKIIRQKKPDKTSSLSNAKDINTIYKYSLINKLASWFYLLEYLFRTINPYIQARCFGKVVICDRYAYDIELIPNASVFAIRCVKSLCATPAINILLHASPEVILDRKQERDIKTIVEHQIIYQKIIRNRLAKYESICIDTGKLNLTEVIATILPVIHQAMHHSYH